MKEVRIAGVPEHFNLPWHMAIGEGAFEERGIDLRWTEVPEGTGKISQLLGDGKTDLAVVLTEGIIKSLNAGTPAKIVQEYIATPLLWGIHVGGSGGYTAIRELETARAAISRQGSGSHLMAYLHAENQCWDPEQLKFEIVHTLDGAVEALTEGRADYFMWERFMTKPLVDSGIFRHLGDFPTPWPCFVIAATDTFIGEHAGILGHILEVINRYTTEFRDIPSIDRTLANRYGQQLSDLREWLLMTHWSQSQLKIQTIELVQNTLINLKLISRIMPPEDYLYSPAG